MIKLRNYPRLSTFLTGGILAAAFAPVFFIPAILTLTIFAYKIKQFESWKSATNYGFWFGFGFFTLGLYWMSIGVSVYINEFWWALPFALFGLPCVLAIFISIGGALSWYFRSSKFYPLILSSIWVFLEWVRSWIFTGLPWNLLGYCLSFSDELIQLASIFGIYGMSFLIIYISASAINVFDEKKRNAFFVLFLVAIIGALSFGNWRLKKYPTTFSDIKLRIVQPSIPQSDKWNLDEFWKNLNEHVELSQINTGFEPDVILWSEAAVTAPYNIQPVKDRIKSTLISPDAILITGGVSEKLVNNVQETYSAMYGINHSGDILFEYHKAHLVPFGEYVPLRSILPIKKLTPGLEDYIAGTTNDIFEIKKLGLKIRPVVCYEIIFPGEIYAKDADVIINVTNDTWYGNSSGPYQHFHMARMRAVEHGIPLVRGANSGISAIIDPLGRIISQTKIGHKTVLDGVLPKKIAKPFYSTIKDLYR